MGCDIHSWIDYKDFQQADGTWVIDNFAALNLSRNYDLFWILAGVRGDAFSPVQPVSKPKGLPPMGMSFEVEDKEYLYIVDKRGNERGVCTLKDAQSWKTKIIYDKDGKPLKSEHPDWHSHSYLFVDELEEAQRRYMSMQNYSDTSFYTAKRNLSATELATGYHVIVPSCDYHGNPDPLGREMFVARGELVNNLEHHKLTAIIAAMKALNGDDPKRSWLVLWFDN